LKETQQVGSGSHTASLPGSGARQVGLEVKYGNGPENEPSLCRAGNNYEQESTNSPIIIIMIRATQQQIQTISNINLIMVT
jgi:hypothetical protein